MLDNEKNKIIEPLECGCKFSLTDYYNSGFHCDTEEEHLLKKFGIILIDGLYQYEMNKGNINTWDKIKDMIDINNLCPKHFFNIITAIVKGTYEFYPKQREHINKIIQSIENSKNKYNHDNQTWYPKNEQEN